MEEIHSNPNAQTSTIINPSATAENERCVNTYYKPNIWSYDYLENLVNDPKVVIRGAQLKKLKQATMHVLNQVTNVSTKLQIVDNIYKLGLENLFKMEITEVFDVISSDIKANPNFIHNVGASALCFRLLRQHGYDVSQGLSLSVGSRVSVFTV